VRALPALARGREWGGNAILARGSAKTARRGYVRRRPSGLGCAAKNAVKNGFDRSGARWLHGPRIASKRGRWLAFAGNGNDGGKST